MDLFLFIPGLIGIYAYWRLIGQNEFYIRQLSSGLLLLKRKGRISPKPSPGWHAQSYEGNYQGRQVQIDYRYRSILHRNQSKKLAIGLIEELEIRLPVVQKFWLRILPQLTESDEREEIIIEKELFDRAFRIYSNQREAATEFLKSTLVQEQFRTLPISIDRLEIHQGWFKALFVQPQERDFKRSDLESVLNNLILLITVYEGQSYRLRVKMMEVTGVCPYCRSEMNENDTIVECQQCATRLHKACWEENKQCTTWGCNSVEAR
jgi:Prokaryotic RING finger family 1